jgi:membrane-bound metal-dependent hydrolase YbcI (DUF457 family)
MLIVLSLVWIHFVADFLLQTDKMATNKSKSNKWLGIHCLVYSTPFLVFGWRFALVTLCLHLVTDYFTSRGTSYLWKREMRHWFFSLIGFDQAIHLTTLILTYHFLLAKNLVWV